MGDEVRGKVADLILMTSGLSQIDNALEIDSFQGNESQSQDDT
jgi:hypothetical protein